MEDRLGDFPGSMTKVPATAMRPMRMAGTAMSWLFRREVISNSCLCQRNTQRNMFVDFFSRYRRLVIPCALTDWSRSIRGTQIEWKNRYRSFHEILVECAER